MNQKNRSIFVINQKYHENHRNQQLVVVIFRKLNRNQKN